jgi:hypothetical protein
VRRLSRAVAVTIALSVLTACGNDPEPRFEADPSPSPTPSSSPTADDPEPWEEKSDEGAIAFVEHWIDLFNEMQLSGETADFRALGTPSCEACDNFVAITDSLYENGSTVRSEGWSVRAADLPAGQKGADRDVSVVIDQASEVITAPDGSEDRNPSGQITVVARLTWTSQGWRVDSVEFPA